MNNIEKINAIKTKMNDIKSKISELEKVGLALDNASFSLRWDFTKCSYKLKPDQNAINEINDQLQVLFERESQLTFDYNYLQNKLNKLITDDESYLEQLLS